MSEQETMRRGTPKQLARDHLTAYAARIKEHDATYLTLEVASAGDGAALGTLNEASEGRGEYLELQFSGWG